MNRHHHNFLGTLQVKSFKSFIVNFASNFLISSGIFLSILCNFPPLNFCIISCANKKFETLSKLI